MNPTAISTSRMLKLSGLTGTPDRAPAPTSPSDPARAASAAGQLRRAAALLGVAHRMRRLIGISPAAVRPHHDLHTATEQRTRAVFGEEDYRAAFACGGRVENVQQFVLEETGQER